MTSMEMKRSQVARVNKLARTLTGMLQGYVDGHEEAFKVGCSACCSLAQDLRGGTMRAPLPRPRLCLPLTLPLASVFPLLVT